ncbi:hydrolase, carbon-nitrogen family [Fibrobacter succinogenes subsp. succinogenes S85]|uniref:Hydrolase, carbon-nitrogen family n=1 Tax=Fibrobacter succinogenes (strain ATCC 19169 / S85) TaxID=59374 RepID=C9RL83_FIBSS|nr:nitrilase-related carbon-nitrogen hydrolase [Fibrobacter succinogenes]ACX74030.1 Nitrilase/cyanide hydratase and apolipoprotein N-acyltransferase [Fibrobacter succinogenes subsp. succinogenes S85]ADL26532.1 hydrolase, carbon-nitrogen family [Fibrobacter succinogenes subsp. succinogenes S85]
MLKVYLVQFDSAKGNKTENLARAKKMILDAKPNAGSLVLLPEMFATGYVPADLDKAAEDFSSNCTGETARTLSEIADETNCTIMGAGITRASTGFYNHVSIYKPNEAQEFRGYNKMNLFFPEKESFKAGSEINLFKFNNWSIASFICYDLRFPEIFREVTKKGANLITIQAAWPAKRRAHWETLLRARAIENQVYIAAVNAVSESNAQKLPLAGTSLIISPNGDILAEGPTQSETVISAELDLQAERDYRKSFPVLEGIVPPEFL